MEYAPDFRRTCALASLLTFAFLQSCSTAPSTHDPLRAQDVGVKLEKSTIDAIASANPAAAMSLLRFSPAHWSPPANLLHGYNLMSAMPTRLSVELYWDLASPEKIRASQSALPEGHGIVNSWSAAELATQQLSVRFRTEHLSPDGIRSIAAPDIHLLIDLVSHRVLSYRIHDLQWQAGDLPDHDGMAQLREHLRHIINRDYVAAAANHSVDFSSAIDSRADVVEFLSGMDTPLTQWFELAKPEVFRSDIATLMLVPSERVLHGYPANIRFPFLFAVYRVAGRDDWEVISNGCLSIGHVQRLIPGFSRSEFQRVQLQPVAPVEVVMAPIPTVPWSSR